MRISNCPAILAALVAGLIFAGMQSLSAMTAVVVAIRGEIAARCSMDTSATSIDLGDLREPGRRLVPISVNCNTPFLVVASSDRGALVSDAPGLVPAAFTDRVVYQARIEIPTDLGLLVHSCDSQKAAGSSCAPADSQGGIAQGVAGQVEISWGRPALEPLAGHYRDKLSITFQPRT